MTIRRALVWLVFIAVMPVFLAGAISLVSLYRAQHAAAGERVLERVRALRVALDVEISATERMLAALAERSQLRQSTVEITPELTNGLRRMASANEMWSAALVIEPDGTETLRVEAATAAGRPRAPLLDQPTRQRVLKTARPQLSPLVGGAGGPLFTFVAVPVLRDGQVLRVLAIAVPSRAWLAFLERYPVDAEATLTLNDGGGRVVARTRDNDLWAGRLSRADYWERTRQSEEGHFRNTSLEGIAFLSAFSRLRQGGWVLGTGIPADAVTRVLWAQAALFGALLLASVLVAALLAAALGRRISRALQDLAALASEPRGDGAAAGSGAAGGHTLPLVEAEAVRQALSAAFREESDSRRAAEQARREREQFVATLAHELRNPLGTIHAALLLLEHPDVDANKKQRGTAILKRQVAQLTRLMADLFEASRPREPAFRLATEGVDLADVCREAVDALQTQGSLGHVSLELDLQPVIAPVDAARLQQVLANLLGNAAKFSPPDGKVRLVLRREGAEAVLTVADEGAGIAPELIDRIFEPFVQGRTGSGNARGLGLGLHVVRRIVELHGGTAEIASGGDQRGTTVTVRLPAAPAAMAR